jgi:hypothetical protein
VAAFVNAANRAGRDAKAALHGKPRFPLVTTKEHLWRWPRKNGAILRPRFARAEWRNCSLFFRLTPFSLREESLVASGSMLLDMLMMSWGVITVILVILVVYRGTLSTREDDQIFIDAAGQHHYQEQLVILDRIARLSKPIIALAVLSGALLLASAGVWIYQGYMSF